MRIEMLPARQGPIWLRVMFGILRRRHGKVSPPLRVYGWKPGILLMFLGMGRSIRKAGEIPERLKRLAMYWTARQVECSF